MQRYHLDVTVRRELGKTLGAIKAAAWVRIAGIHIHDCFSLKAEGANDSKAVWCLAV
jgi:hypothetical protein